MPEDDASRAAAGWWERPFDPALDGAAPTTVTVGGVALAKGSRVRLRPGAGHDILDLALAGRVAVIEGIEQDHEDRIHVAVTLEDDPGRDLGEARFPGHRFFFGLDEIEPVDGAHPGRPRTLRVLVAGIGNVFFGDDGFGVEVARRLHERALPPGVRVADFGIRGVDLAYALGEGWDAAILVDAAPRGHSPGTLSVIEPDPEGQPPTVPDGHSMDPVTVLRLARQLGAVPARTLVVACEPGAVPAGTADEDVTVGLSEPVAAAVDGAVQLVESLIVELGHETQGP